MKKLLFITSYLVLIISHLYSQSNHFTIGDHQVIFDNQYYYDLLGDDSIKVDTTRVLLKFSESVLIATRNAIISYGFTELSHSNSGVYCFKYPLQESFLESATWLSNQSNIEEIHWSHLLKPPYLDVTIPHDQHTANPPYWELIKTQIAYSPDVEDYAWQHTVGEQWIRVAIIDDGLLWSDADFSPDNGLGYDYYNGDPNPEPTAYEFSHGTTMASIIAARTGNQFGLCGIAGGYYYDTTIYPITMMALRVGGPLEWSTGALYVISYQLTHMPENLLKYLINSVLDFYLSLKKCIMKFY